MSARDPELILTEARPAAITGVVVGKLIAVKDDGRTGMVLYPGQPGTATLTARSVIDLCGHHVSGDVVLMFDGGDAEKPIVMGVLRQADAWPATDRPAQVEVDADGARLTVSAKEQVVLRCGKSSITLTATGKVLIQGEYVVSRAAGVNRVKGGSVQIN